MMVNDLAFQRMRAKFRATGTINDDLYQLLMGLVRAVIFGGMTPRSLSPTGVWDKDSAQDAAHDWMTQRLLNPRNNTLLAAFDHGVTPRKFLNSLEMSFRSHLKSRAARTELDNVSRRAGRLLRDDKRFREWLPQSKPTHSWWGLASWNDPQPFSASDDALISEAWALGEVALVRYGSDVSRASPVVSTTALASFLEGLFDRIGGLLTRAHLRHVFERRFALTPTSSQPFDDNDLPELPEETRPSDDELNQLADLILADIKQRQAKALKLKAQGATLEEIASELSVSRGTADNELKRIGAIISRYADDEASQRQLLEIVLGRLS
jgi:hypothetical protein